MDEVIKKLIERLEEEIFTCQSAYAESVIGMCGKSAENYISEMHAFEKTKKIVNQLAEEYNNESVKGDLISRSALLKELHKIEFPSYKNYDLQDVFDMCEDKVEQAPIAHNNGWIPCSERLPEVKKEVLIFADDNAVFVGRLMNGGFGVHDGDGWIDLKFILAWQPLPAPYQPKGE